MTESTGTENPITPDAPPADKPKAKRKTAAEKAAEKAAAEAPESKRESRNLYLPALPDGFEYTSIIATGPNGATINISADASGEPGAAVLSFEGAGLKRDVSYADMKSAVAAGSKAAKGIADIAKREAELAAKREEAFDL